MIITKSLQTENFTRTLTNETESTPNDYYRVSWNYFALPEIPGILPLPIIHRIKSDLHIHNKIPTIHHNQTADINVNLNMTYIR